MTHLTDRPSTRFSPDGPRPRRHDLQVEPARRVRAAVTLLLLTLVLPGSAQLAKGNARLGRIALTVWLCLASCGLLEGVLLLVDQHTALGLLTDPTVLAVAAVVAMLTALAWPVLVVDAWRLGRPALLPRRMRPRLAALTAVLTVLTLVVPAMAARRAWAASDVIGSIFGSGQVSSGQDGRLNVLLLGGDAGPDRVGTRPDSITLASIDTTTGRTVLFSLPRNLQDVPFLPGTPAAKAMPKGWSCGDTCLLNAVYTWGAQHRSLFPGATDAGAAAMKQVVQAVTGLPVNYYVLIDLQGFRGLIDALGGVRVTVKAPVPIGGETSKISGYIKPGTQVLDGYHALWFARSRTGASDYARMSRQRCVMDAMLHQLDPATVLSRFQSIAAASKQVVSTDIPAAGLADLIELAVKARSQKVSSVQFVPPLVDPTYPSFTTIRRTVASALAASTAASASAAPKPSATGAGAASKATGGTASSRSGASASSGTATPKTGATGTPHADDIHAACSAA